MLRVCIKLSLSQKARIDNKFKHKKRLLFIEDITSRTVLDLSNYTTQTCIISMLALVP